jgi:hypothetical protein
VSEDNITKDAGRMIARGFFFAVGAFVFRGLLDILSRDDEESNVVLVLQGDDDD